MYTMIILSKLYRISNWSDNYLLSNFIYSLFYNILKNKCIFILVLIHLQSIINQFNY